MHPEIRTLAAWAGAHHGLFRYVDATRAGLTRPALGHLVRVGWCERPARGIYRVQSAPSTFQQRALALVWASGDDAVASHRAAGRLYGLPGFASAHPEITRPHGQNQKLGTGHVHVSQCLPTFHRRVIDEIPVTSVPRTVFDIAGVVHPKLAERTLDTALQRKLCTIEQVQQAFFLLARRGRRGTATMRSLLEARGTGYIAPASELERFARQVFREAGLPEPEYEMDLGGEDWIGRVDCLWRSAKLVVELDGRRYHDGRSANLADRHRDNALTAAGWRVIRVTWDDLRDRPEVVVAWIRKALAAAA